MDPENSREGKAEHGSEEGWNRDPVMETPGGEAGLDVELDGEPGAAPHGNFMNYYSFNPPENRLQLIPAALLQELGYEPNTETLLLLDVGCNSGELSVALYKHLVPDQASNSVYLLGLDLDPNLILRARGLNPFPERLQFLCLDIMVEQTRARLSSYLQDYARRRFHLCVCLAVTMWVHLNHGDAAFCALLDRLASVCDHLLLEVQPWKCYRSAARRLRKLGRSDFDHFKDLEIRGDMAAHATEYLEMHCGMELTRSFGNTTWDRSLLLFRRR